MRMFKDDSLFKRFDAAMTHGALKLIVLAHFRDGGTYPYAMLKHFKSSGHRRLAGMGKSEIYNIINSLEKEGFVSHRVVKKGTQSQKHYALTPKGRKVLGTSKQIMIRAMGDFRKLVKSEFGG
jgi:DNA-binding PadR family transcriptional regulator